MSFIWSCFLLLFFVLMVRGFRFKVFLYRFVWDGYVEDVWFNLNGWGYYIF